MGRFYPNLVEETTANAVKAGMVPAWWVAYLFMEERTMRRMFIMLIAAAAIGGAAFGRGTGDGGGQGSGSGAGFGAGGEIVTLSGTVEKRDDHVVLVTGKGIFTLSAPGFYRSGEEIPLGETVQVSGTLNTGTCEECDINAEGHVFVASAIVDGRQLSFEAGRGGNGGRNSAMGNRWSDDNFGNRNGNRGGGRGGNGSGPRYGQSTGA
jgi:hypothetical protein